MSSTFHIKKHHVPLHEVQTVVLKPLHYIFLIDLNSHYLMASQLQNDPRIPWEDLKDETQGNTSQIDNSNNISSSNIPNRFSGIVDITLRHLMLKNNLVTKCKVYGAFGKQLLLLYQTPDAQLHTPQDILNAISKSIEDNISQDQIDLANILPQFILETQNLVQESSNSFIQSFVFIEGGQISKEGESKCIELNTGLHRATNVSSVTLKKMLEISQRDFFCSDFTQLQYMIWLEVEYLICFLDVIQSKSINRYEKAQKVLNSYHQDHPIKLDKLQSIFKVCQEVSGDLPTEDNKGNERKELVQANLKKLSEINEQLSKESFAHPKISLQQALSLKKMLLQLIQCGASLDEERYSFQQKAQGLTFEKEDVGKYFSECMIALKSATDSKLEVFNTEVLQKDVNIHAGYLLECVRQDLLYTKKLFEICKEINNKIFIFRKNVEKCNQKDLAEFIEQELVRIQAVQFKALRNVENSVSRLFLSLNQTLDAILLQLKNLKINTRRKAVFEELTNLIRANSDYQTYLTSGSEGTQLGRSFKLLIESYFKEFLK